MTDPIAQTHLDADQSELCTVKLRCEALRADLAAQRAYSGRALANAWRLIHQLRNERARWQALQAENDNYARQLAALTSSTSWRLTAPLRALAEQARTIALLRALARPLRALVRTLRRHA